MARLQYTHCRNCSERLANHDAPYCPPCNLSLAYRAMPILLGMLLFSHAAPASVSAAAPPRPREP